MSAFLDHAQQTTKQFLVPKIVGRMESGATLSGSCLIELTAAAQRHDDGAVTAATAALLALKETS